MELLETEALGNTSGKMTKQCFPYKLCVELRKFVVDSRQDNYFSVEIRHQSKDACQFNNSMLKL